MTARRDEILALARVLQEAHRAEVQKLDIGWWCVAVSLRGEFLGGIFVSAFGPVDAADEIRKRGLLSEILPYAMRFVRIVKDPPVAVRFKLLTLEELKLLESDAI